MYLATIVVVVDYLRWSNDLRMKSQACRPDPTANKIVKLR